MKLFNGCLILVCIAAFSACSDLETKQKHEELKLWYDEPAEKWTDALPLGNGRLGAMIFGEVEQERIQFNEETLWTGEPRDYHREGAVKFLPDIRRLLSEGKQEEAELLAGEKFMGKRSNEDHYNQDKAAWIKSVSAQVDFAQPNYDVSQWKEMGLPVDRSWESEGLIGIDGAVWFRTTFELPADWQRSDLELRLGKIRDLDYTYVNGQRVGTTNGKNEYRVYTIPSRLLKKGLNHIAVQVINFYDKGGFVGFRDEAETLRVFPKGAPENKISLNGNWNYHVQNRNPPAVPRFQAAYQPFGDLWINFDDHNNITHYKRELDIENAVARITYKSGGVQYTREYFASEPNQVIVVRLAASEPGKITFDAALSSPHYKASTKKIGDRILGLSVEVQNGVLRGESQVMVSASGGGYQVTDDKIFVKKANEVTLYLTAGTNYVNYKDVSADPTAVCEAALQTVNKINYDSLKAAHVKEYRSYFDQLSIDLGNAPDSLTTDQRLANFNSSADPAFVALYLQYGRYLLISSSRPGTRPPNLQGIWNDLLTPPWDSKYTSNINFEMNYWPAELLNLSECHEPLFKTIEEMTETGQQTAKAHYGARGWVSHHNTDLWRGTAPINASNHGIWVTGGAWLTLHMWEHYLFTKDSTFLRDRAYPVMKEAAMFFIDFLVKDPKTGWFISTPSNSPENGGLVAGPTMDHQIIRSLFKACIQASKILSVDSEFRDQLNRIYPEIAPNQIGQHGQLQEWLEDKDDPDDHHRHVSHLWGVHPGKEINWEQTPELMKAARQSLIFRGDEGTGWSLAWKINFWARFRDGEKAFKLIKMLLSPAEDPDGSVHGGSYKNLFDAHPPFQIDGNFGGAAGIAELLVQSHLDKIELLPALPKALSAGEIKGVCARGGFTLNMKWNDNELQQVEVISKAGGNCTLSYNDKTINFETEKGNTYALDGDLEFL